MSLHFSRNTKVYLEQGANIWEIPVLDGFSFSQATNASEITLNEMTDTAGNSRRARQMFNDSYAPAEWTFASYMRPNAIAGVDGGAVEEALWANFVAANSWSSGAGWDSAVSSSSANNTQEFLFTSSNKSVLGTFNLYFVMGASSDADENYTSSSAVTIYKIADCVANEASIDFEIDGIAQINWSGFGKIITDESSLSASAAIARDVTSTSNFIRNRLTSLSAVSAISGSSRTYSLTLTGGNITMNNNMTYLTPETLGVVNQPLGHVTGTRNIGGNFTCYLSTATNASTQLFEDVIGATTTVTNDFDLTFKIGGDSAPNVKIAMPNCHLELPVHSIDDVVALETTFHGLPSDISSADEAVITYTGS